MADVPYLAYLPARLTVFSDPLNLRKWGETAAGVVTVGGLWLGYSKVTDPAWPNNGKPYWVQGTLPEYVATEPDPEPVPTEPTTPAGALSVNLPDGSQLVNRDAIVWVKGAG